MMRAIMIMMRRIVIRLEVRTWEGEPAKPGGQLGQVENQGVELLLGQLAVLDDQRVQVLHGASQLEGVDGGKIKGVSSA